MTDLQAPEHEALALHPWTQHVRSDQPALTPPELCQDQPLADWVTERKIDRTAYLLPQNVGLDMAVQALHRGSARPVDEVPP